MYSPDYYILPSETGEGWGYSSEMTTTVSKSLLTKVIFLYPFICMWYNVFESNQTNKLPKLKLGSADDENAHANNLI